MRAYLIPGLGTDGRIFKNLIAEINFDEVHYLDYRDDICKKCQGMADYAKEISKEIIDDQDSIIIGLSLGGMLATELSKLLANCKIILISSIKTEQEAPSIIKVARFMPFYNFVPLWFSRNIVPLMSRLAMVTDQEGYHLYRQMLKGWSAAKLKWARKSAVHWKNQESVNCLHIHGTKDNIFPFHKIKHAVLIEKGSHYMVMDRSKEIAGIIIKTLLS